MDLLRNTLCKQAGLKVYSVALLASGLISGCSHTSSMLRTLNLRTQHAIYLYPSTCLFEGTICSLGRGTEFPFEVYGHPDYTGSEFSFTPHSMAGAKNPPLKDKLCYGVDLRLKDDEQIIAEVFNLEYIVDAYRNLNAHSGVGKQFFTPMFELLVGVDYVREMIIAGHFAEEIRAVWQADLEEFKALR